MRRVRSRLLRTEASHQRKNLRRENLPDRLGRRLVRRGGAKEDGEAAAAGASLPDGDKMSGETQSDLSRRHGGQIGKPQCEFCSLGKQLILASEVPDDQSRISAGRCGNITDRRAVVPASAKSRRAASMIAARVLSDFLSRLPSSTGISDVTNPQ